jgi:cysteinyl-tRNA synthetase
MLRVMDAESRRPVVIGGRRGGLVRLHVLGVRVDCRASVGELRAVLVADLVRRVLEELDECQVFVTIVHSGHDREKAGMDRMAALAGDLAELWIPPPAAVTASVPDRPAHLVVADRRWLVADGVPGLSVGPVDSPSGATLADVCRGGRDPLTVRLALLAAHHDRPARLDADVLDRAEATVGRWRALVAVWADAPSAPMPTEIVARVRRALRDDLDVAAVLDALAELADDRAVLAGAKFETFAHLDRFLGLDLARGLAVSRGG